MFTWHSKKKHQQKQHVQSTRCVTHSRLSSVSCLARNRWKSGWTFRSAVRSVHPSTFFFYEMKNWQSGSSLSSDRSVWNSWAEATVTSGYKPITSCLTLLRDVCLHSGQLKGVLVRISRERFFSYCPVWVKLLCITGSKVLILVSFPRNLSLRRASPLFVSNI